MECFGTVVSVSLQHGVPLKVLCDKLSHTRFEPSGYFDTEVHKAVVYQAGQPIALTPMGGGGTNFAPCFR
jgi:hypothetical protein